jgi:glucan 1,3-beta-glucosidase
MHGTMGVANAQRTLTYLQVITQFISQEQYKNVVPLLGIVNEILLGTVELSPTQSFYYAAYEAIRTASGLGDKKGPFIVLHDGFQGPAFWEGYLLFIYFQPHPGASQICSRFLSGADRVIIDQHPYLAFMDDHSDLEVMSKKPCEMWAIATNQSQSAFGVTVAGEFSSATNNCGLW